MIGTCHMPFIDFMWLQLCFGVNVACDLPTAPCENHKKHSCFLNISPIARIFFRVREACGATRRYFY